MRGCSCDQLAPHVVARSNNQNEYLASLIVILKMSSWLNQRNTVVYPSLTKTELRRLPLESLRSHLGQYHLCETGTKSEIVNRPINYLQVLTTVESDSSSSDEENEQFSDPEASGSESPSAATSPKSEPLSDDDQPPLKRVELVDTIRDIMQKRKHPTISPPSDDRDHAPSHRSCKSHALQLLNIVIELSGCSLICFVCVQQLE